MRSIILQLFAIVLLVAGGVAVWNYGASLPLIGAFFQADEAAGGGGGGPPAIPVDIAVAVISPVTVVLEALGTAVANEAVTLTSEVTGTIKRIRFEEGQAVEPGTVLVDLDASIARAQVEVRQADVQVRQAELAYARQLYDRAEQLRQRQNVAEARVDELAAELRAAEAALLSAEATVRAAQALVVKYRIVAPFGGRLGIRHVSVGALIEPGDPIITLDDISVVKLDFRIAERDLADIHVGQEITAQADAYDDEVFFGTVVSIDTRVDPVTRAASVRAVVDNPLERLKPGMFLLIELDVATRSEAVVIPEEAVVGEGTEHYVFVVEDGTVRRQTVYLGQRRPGEVEVLGGVLAGEQVITGGVQKVRDGATVAPRQPQIEAAQADG